MNQPKPPRNDIGFLILWGYLMVVSIVLAPIIAYAIKRWLES